MKSSIAILIFALPILVVSDEELSLVEGGDITRKFTKSFFFMLNLLSREFPNIDSPSLQFINLTVSNVVAKNKSTMNMSDSDSTLTFNVKEEAFTFEATFFWIYNFGLLPITGNAIASISLREVLYRIIYKNKTLTPILDKLTFKVIDLAIKDNPLAELLKIKAWLIPAFANKINTVVVDYMKNKMMSRVKKLLSFVYPETRKLIFPYYDRNHSVGYNYELSKISLNSPFINVKYKPVKGSKDRLNFNKPISFENNEISALFKFPLEIVNTTLSKVFNELYKSFTITSQDIPSQAMFHLSGRQFAQVIPDFYMSNGDKDISVKVASLFSKSEVKALSQTNLLISGFKFDLTFTSGQEKLLNANVAINATFSPVLTTKPNDISTYLDLKIESVSIDILKCNKQDYDIFYKDGLKNFLNGAFENWISVYYSRKVLSNGIYIEYEGIIDHLMSNASVDTSLNANIYLI